ncbi:chromate efflux transporter [Wenzhouxiangella marina]|uniref:Chromate ion family chromate transporter n=1 Tax=Wenzhouxiangella marina TaxID=1579979 RepID=A0A0K0XU30_9GAMM|nr:chromate efflux transporter [Wenzhouxiangella marina]AKS41137.1 chromate ion family chromate transporter [Wenzhouxiangella marina]MBB6088016.1 chromate transporter [Wenzhouxiangella marina]
MTRAPATPTATGSAAEVFLVFLKLGLTAFGGPVAHMGYFRAELVERRTWLSDAQFGQLLAISQLLPGPASSQLGFCLGLLRAGWPGAVAAFVAFTLPSALLLIAFAYALPLASGPVAGAVLAGLKLVAVAVVAAAVYSMWTSLCTQARTRAIAVLSTAALLLLPAAWLPLLIIPISAVLGSLVLRDPASADRRSRITSGHGRRTAAVLLALFLVLLLGLPLLASGQPDPLSVADAFYRAGALVFGGGHVVLPLLEDSMVSTGWVRIEDFLAGYGAAQAVPGPLFSFSAYLGTLLGAGEPPLLMAGLALIFMFLPGFLLVAGVLPFWAALSDRPLMRRAIAGVNAAVVGLLAAALVDPVFTSAVSGLPDLLIALLGFLALVFGRLSPLLVVIGCVLARVALLGLP